MNIESIIKQGENQSVEFKTVDVRPESLAKEVVAFANTVGGTVLIGVADDGKVLGIGERDDIQDWVANIVRTNVIPPIDCNIEVVETKGEKICAIEVPKGVDKPYQTNRHQYLIRIGATNRVASIQELMRLFQQAGIFHYDSTTVKNTKLSDLNFSTLDDYFSKYQIEFSEEEDKRTLLNNVDLMVGDEVTVAGLLIFGINPQKYLFNACISYAHYHGSEISDDLIDKQLIQGTLADQIDKTLSIINHNIKRPSKIQGAKTVDTVVHYSDKVLRELIVNSVVHRSYSIIGSRIRIFQYDNRLEFISPGRLPNTVTIEKLRYGVSYAANPVLLKFLENMRYVDKLGRGLPLVYQEAKRLQREVIFEEIGEEFKVTLFF